MALYIILHYILHMIPLSITYDKENICTYDKKWSNIKK